MGFKEFKESFKKKYRAEDLYLLLRRRSGDSASERLSKDKEYCYIVIKNKDGNKIKFIENGSIRDILKEHYTDNLCTHKAIWIEGGVFRLIPLIMLGVEQKKSEIRFNFFSEGDVIPSDLYDFCDIMSLAGKYVARDSLVHNVLSREKKNQLLCQREVVALQGFINNTIHEAYKEKIQAEREAKVKFQKANKEKVKQQKIKEIIEQEKDF